MSMEDVLMDRIEELTKEIELLKKREGHLERYVAVLRDGIEEQDDEIERLKAELEAVRACPPVPTVVQISGTAHGRAKKGGDK